MAQIPLEIVIRNRNRIGVDRILICEWNRRIGPDREVCHELVEVRNGLLPHPTLYKRRNP